MGGMGELIKQARQLRGMSQEELGKAIGKTKSAISKYELGHREPSLRGVELLAEALNVSPAFLQGYELPPEAGDTYPPFPEDLADSFLKGKTGDNLRRLRELNGLTQKALAESIGFLTKDIRVFEDDTSTAYPTEEDIKRFSEVFQVEPKYIVGTGIKPKIEYHEKVFDLERRIGVAMSKLNLEGKIEAVKRIEEMVDVARYQAQWYRTTPPLDSSEGK